MRTTLILRNWKMPNVFLLVEYLWNILVLTEASPSKIVMLSLGKSLMTAEAKISSWPSADNIDWF